MRIILAILMLALGLWLFHDVSVYQGVLAARGQGDLDALTGNAPFMMRFAGSLLILVGSAVSLRWKWPGWIILALGVAIHVLLVAAMVLMGADISLWQRDAMLTAGLLIISAGLFTLKSA